MGIDGNKVIEVLKSQRNLALDELAIACATIEALKREIAALKEGAPVGNDNKN